MSNRSELDLDDIPEHILKYTEISSPIIISAPTAIDDSVAVPSSSGLNVKVGMSMAEIEKEVLRATLQYAGNNKAKAAKILGLSKRTIFRKIQEPG
jgi:DNA-binding NtrC family response regulator